MKRCRNLREAFLDRPLPPGRVFVGFGRRNRGQEWSAGVETPCGSALFPGDRKRAKPAGGSLPKGRPSRSKNKPQRGKTQERREPGCGVTPAVRRRARWRAKAERWRNLPHGHACMFRRTGFQPSGRSGVAGMQFHRMREQPLKGEAQERRRSETRPARLGREKAVARVAKP